ncbi:unnamed protein product [Musa acuminata subsp. malaccensis]|uniref:(wild Malaysian banana) hypothetical protein n=1 Tax=Musa acuminata subsp. malaccensis TaxID=214687 RepID=A0A804J944_MUSAM|nr:unnamed protein product [Musa acuminata subsp. malaccensis]
MNINILLIMMGNYSISLDNSDRIRREILRHLFRASKVCL